MGPGRYHLTIDGRSEVNINDKALVRMSLIRLVQICKMKILRGPIIVKGVPANPGVTGLVIIDFSTISIHTFSKSNKVMIDVFSCKPYNYAKAKKFVIDTFKIKVAEVVLRTPKVNE